LSYFRVDRAEIGGIKIYVKRWVPESRRSDRRKDAEHTPIIGLSNGTNHIEFKNADDLSDFVRKLKISNGQTEPCWINLPVDTLGEVVRALEELALKILWVLEP
jgi:hypothetical protein